MMDWIYTAISWILLRWHGMWDAVLPSAPFLGTNWDWILAIVFLVITVRIILFPIFVKQIRSQRAMQALQPKVKELQAKHKGDQETLRQEMMKLYQTEKVNPLMGCLPMFLQIPVFLGLFHVLQRLDPVQSLNTTLYTWTQAEWDGAAVARIFGAPIASRFADGATQLNLFDANGATVKVVAGVLVLIMMCTTFMTSRQMILKTGWSADPQQRMIQKLMLYGIPVSLLLSGWYFPIGVIIYWVTQNIFSLGQQYWVLHKYPPPAMEAATAVGAKKAPAPEAPRNIVQRFLVPTAKPVPNGASGAVAASNGAVSPARRESRLSLFRRKPAPAAPVVPRADSRSLAPKPGAKPAHPRSVVTDSRSADSRSADSGAIEPRLGAIEPRSRELSSSVGGTTELTDTVGEQAPAVDQGRGAPTAANPTAASPAAASPTAAKQAPTQPAAAKQPAAGKQPAGKQSAGKQPTGKQSGANESGAKQSKGRSGGPKRNPGNARKRNANKKGGSKR